MLILVARKIPATVQIATANLIHETINTLYDIKYYTITNQIRSFSLLPKL